LLDGQSVSVDVGLLTSEGTTNLFVDDSSLWGG
jgi:hypothetical protein